MEIERKFLVNNIDNIDLSKYEKKRIEQNYLYLDKLTAIRKRKIVIGNKIKYTYTIKTDKKGISVNEIEKEIDKDTYESLGININFISLIKDRYIIPYKGYRIELDVFDGFYNGIIFAEIEFKNEEEANTLELPKWFGIDISNKITNADTASCDLKDTILKIK